MKRVGLIGGGRWGQVIHGALNTLLRSGDEILWFTRYLPAEVQSIATSSAPGRPQTRIVADRDTFWGAGISGAIIASDVARHAEDATAALQHNVATLVEKPLAQSMSQAEALVRLARDRDVALGVNLEYLSASYLHAMADLCPWSRVERLDLHWVDPWVEQRGGAHKVADLTVNRAMDIMPHIWSILDILSGGAETTVLRAECDVLPGAAHVALRAGAVPVTAIISRHGDQRERALDFVLTDGERIRLDFATEPGTVTRNDQIVAFESGWDLAPSPLTASLSAFLRHIADPGGDWPFDAARTLDHVRLSETSSRAIAARDLDNAVRLVRSGASANSNALQAVLREFLLPALARMGEAGKVKHIARDRDACYDFTMIVLSMLRRGPDSDNELADLVSRLDEYRRLEDLLR